MKDSKVKIYTCMSCGTKDNTKLLYNSADTYICDKCREETEFMCDMMCG